METWGYSMCFEIENMGKSKHLKRIDISENYGEIFLKDIMIQSPCVYTVEDILRTSYQDEIVCCEKMQLLI